MSDSLDPEKLLEKIAKLEETKHNLTLDRDRYKRRNASLVREAEHQQLTVELEKSVLGAKTKKVPTWSSGTSKKVINKHNAWDVQMFSDWHLGEVQLMEEVGGYNSYNAKVAEMRLEHTVKSSLKISKEFTAGINFDGACLPMSGDILTGEIHEELTKTNSETITETIVKWVPKWAAVVQAFADEYPKVHVPMVTGNHDRRGRVMESKNAARDSYSWVIYHWIADYFRDNDRVTFQIPNSLDVRFNIYDTRFMMNHGYGMKGGGSGGAVNAIMTEYNRYRNRDQVIGNDFDWYLCGHLHQTVFAQGAIMSGCGKGFDSYAHNIKCKPEPPSQAKFFVTPERGVTMRIPILCEAPGERKHWT